MQKPCLQCKKVFNITRKRRRLCCARCQALHQKQYAKEYWQRPGVRERQNQNARDWYKSDDGKQYYARVRERKRALTRRWWKSDKGKKYNTEVHRRRYQSEVEYKIKQNLRSRLGVALKSTPKTFTTLQILGCTITELREHLATQFKPGMTWENYGQWHIDHKIPCAAFDLTNSKQQSKCFHYTNLQPLWATDNLRKGATLSS